MWVCIHISLEFIVRTQCPKSKLGILKSAQDICTIVSYVPNSLLLRRLLLCCTADDGTLSRDSSSLNLFLLLRRIPWRAEYDNSGTVRQCANNWFLDVFFLLLVRPPWPAALSFELDDERERILPPPPLPWDDSDDCEVLDVRWVRYGWCCDDVEVVLLFDVLSIFLVGELRSSGLPPTKWRSSPIVSFIVNCIRRRGLSSYLASLLLLCFIYATNNITHSLDFFHLSFAKHQNFSNFKLLQASSNAHDPLDEQYILPCILHTISYLLSQKAIV